MPAGNPFKPKAAGYAAPSDPVGKLTEIVTKVSASMENLFSSFTHLAESVKLMDRQATRIAFMGAIAAGPRNPVPYDIRDVLRGHGGRGSRGPARGSSRRPRVPGRPSPRSPAAPPRPRSRRPRTGWFVWAPAVRSYRPAPADSPWAR
jgi:hypothetical protein